MKKLGYYKKWNGGEMEGWKGRVLEEGSYTLRSKNISGTFSIHAIFSNTPTKWALGANTPIFRFSIIK
ncbi:MAG: hypothetical protein GWN61_20685 [candidate division Zixibacteria bacterium]|nr:hypothetical protein [candidate division Zixibacteria bacterium]NIU16403.1 hypothetical protein [candidate division Zixibacteria bacterium]NIV08524.1 hypothetical protein [candidate division Zixibacteria bacterium]